MRASVAKRVRYKVFLDRNDFGDIISVFMSEDEYANKDKLDRAVIAKIAHWNHSYMKPMNSIPEKFNHLTAQFSLIASLTAVEAAIGMPKNRSRTRIYEFFDNNLSITDKDEFAKGIKFFNTNSGNFENRSLEDVIEQLVQRRNGLLHRAELINLVADGDIRGVGTRGHTTGRKAAGKTAHYLDISLSAKEMSGYVNKALINYFDKHWSVRLPQQDYSIWKKTKKQKSKSSK